MIDSTIVEINGGAFADVPADVNELFVAADFTWFVERGHRVSTRTIERVLRV